MTGQWNRSPNSLWGRAVDLQVAPEPLLDAPQRGRAQPRFAPGASRLPQPRAAGSPQPPGLERLEIQLHATWVAHARHSARNPVPSQLYYARFSKELPSL